jgi:hypothetical protein
VKVDEMLRIQERILEYNSDEENNPRTNRKNVEQELFFENYTNL